MFTVSLFDVLWQPAFYVLLQPALPYECAMFCVSACLPVCCIEHGLRM